MNEVKQIRDIESQMQVLKAHLRFVKALFAMRVQASEQDEEETAQVCKIYNDGFLSESEYISRLSEISACSSDQFAELLYVALQYKEIQKS